MRTYTNYRRDGRRRPDRKKLILGVGIIVLLCTAAWFIFSPKEKNADSLSTDPLAIMQTDPAPKEQAPKPEFDAARLMQTLSDWVATHQGTHGVVLTDQKGNVLASANPDQSFFAASIYKLYVAYIGYQRVDNGTFDAQESYLGGWTRSKCLDEMIRSSHSSCAEKMWVELGKENLNTQLKGYGLKNTSMTGLTTTAADAGIILARIQRGEGLSEQSRAKMLDSMLGQIYRDAMPKGFAPLKVYDKVGFRERVEYHDVGIVELADGRHLIVSILTENVGTRNIIGLSKAILEVAKNRP